MIEVVFAFLFGIVFGLAYLPARDAFREHFTVVSLEIEAAMASVVEGGTFNFTVVAKNAAGRVVPDKGITASVDPQAGTVAVGDDGSGGVFSAGATDGDFGIVATDGKLKSAPFVVTVTADNTPASLEVVAA